IGYPLKRTNFGNTCSLNPRASPRRARLGSVLEERLLEPRRTDDRCRRIEPPGDELPHAQREDGGGLVLAERFKILCRPPRSVRQINFSSYVAFSAVTVAQS